ncbi:MAG: phosphatidate cytidylyltransferase [Clostridiales bacterium]|nr:phosphatidate cytidylyltransferase [Clostridiales bacterium]
MKKRILVGVPLALLLLAVVFIDSIYLTFLILLFGVVAQFEMSKALNKAGYTPTLWTGIVFLVLIFPADYYFGIKGVFLLFAIMTGLNMCWAVLYRKRNFMDIIMSEFMLCYPALPFYFLFMIKTIDPHVMSVLAMCMTLVIASLNDTLAYFIGSKFGKRKMAPELSPKKTIEGAIGGIVGSVVIGFVILMLLVGKSFPDIHWMHLLFGCLASSIFAVVGDLIASAVKRFCKIKDFGHIFPGHGGVLDRLDSYLLSSIAIYTYFSIFIL